VEHDVTRCEKEDSLGCLLSRLSNHRVLSGFSRLDCKKVREENILKQEVKTKKELIEWT
jgi:hypothetical protein